MGMESHGGMILTGENWRTQRRTCPSATLSSPLRLVFLFFFFYFIHWTFARCSSSNIVVGYVNFRAVGSRLDVAVTHDGFGCVSVHCAQWTGPFREVKSRNPLSDGGPRLVLPASTTYIVIHVMTKLLEVKNVGHKQRSLSLCVVVQFVTLL
jgi:hypothetical protein